MKRGKKGLLLICMSLISFVLILSLNMVSAVEVYNITSCGYTVSNPGVYIVRNDLLMNGSAVCITINSDGVSLAGMGYSIIKDAGGTGEGKGISVENRNYFEIVGFKMEATSGTFDKGIYARNVSNCTILDNDLTDYSYGIYFQDGDHCDIQYNNLKSTEIGIHVKAYQKNVTGNTILMNNITEYQSMGIYFYSQGKTVSNNIISYNEMTRHALGGAGEYALYLQTSSAPTSNISNNHFYGNNFYSQGYPEVVQTLGKVFKNYWNTTIITNYSSAVNVTSNVTELIYTYTPIGNHWDYYSGANCSGGVCSPSSYVINENNTDFEPLINVTTKRTYNMTFNDSINEVYVYSTVPVKEMEILDREGEYRLLSFLDGDLASGSESLTLQLHPGDNHLLLMKPSEEASGGWNNYPPASADVFIGPQDPTGGIIDDLFLFEPSYSTWVGSASISFQVHTLTGPQCDQIGGIIASYPNDNPYDFANRQGFAPLVDVLDGGALFVTDPFNMNIPSFLDCGTPPYPSFLGGFSIDDSVARLTEVTGDYFYMEDLFEPMLVSCTDFVTISDPMGYANALMLYHGAGRCTGWHDGWAGRVKFRTHRHKKLFFP